MLRHLSIIAVPVLVLLINTCMPRLSLWDPVKTNDYTFIDRLVGEHVYAGGTGVNIHKYIGVQDTADINDPTQPGTGTTTNDELFIQDLLFLENRDRKYSDDIYELRAYYEIHDGDAFDLTQFGAFLANDTVFMTFHIESMVEALGRKLMPGDVLELPHLRDDLLLGKEGAINRFYVVQDGARPAEGFDPRWWPHLWRVKLGPITDSPEYRDIIGDGTGEAPDDIRDLISSYQNDITVNDAVLDQAENDVTNDPQYRDASHLYFDPSTGKPGVNLYGVQDGLPDNGGTIVGSGASFPLSATDGDYFLRTDFSPHRLFKKDGTRWIKVSDDNKQAWATANRILTTFINNDNITTTTDGEQVPEKQNLSKVVKPRTDL